jgi:hypothetical protein
MRYQGLEQRSREGADASGKVQHGAGTQPVSPTIYHAPAAIGFRVSSPARNVELRREADRSVEGCPDRAVPGECADPHADRRC